MKRAALLLVLLGAAARADNAFHVDLALPTTPAAPPAAQKANGTTKLDVVPPVPAAVKAAAGVRRPVIINGGFARIINNGRIIFSGNGQAASSDSSPQVPTLHWKNGESVEGDLAATSGNDLSWKSSLFEDPLELRWDVIDRIEWPSKDDQPKDPFSIALRDGSFIYGDLVSVGPTSISIHSTRHGDTVLKRPDILSIRRRQNTKLVYAGPTGDLGWEAMNTQQDGTLVRNAYATPVESPLLTTAPGGAMQIRSWNRSAVLNLTLPPAIDVEFRLHSSKRPEFLVALGGNVPTTLRVETWDNILVLSCDSQFKIIRKIEDTERDVALRVCFDANTRECSVFTPEGGPLTSWKVPGNTTGSTPGFVVVNRGLDLSLDMLRVRAWDGKAPAKIDPKHPHIELDDGRGITGDITGRAPGSISIQSPGQAAASFPLKDVDAVVFSTDAPQSANRDMTLTFNDGTTLLGRIAAINNGRATFTTSFSEQPLFAQMDSPRQLLIHLPTPAGATPEPSLDTQDKIVIGETTLHGRIGTTDDGSIGWLPIGATKASRLSRSQGSEIARAMPKDVPLSSDPALFYLNSGDILPGSLRSLDRAGAEIESSLMNGMKLPSGQLEAIEFSPGAQLDVQSFSDPAWETLKGDEKSVRRNDNGIELDAGTSISMPSLMQTGEFSFKYASNGFSAARVRLFCAGKDDSHSINILICNSGNQFTSGLETNPGQFDNQFQTRVQPGTPVTVRFKIEDNHVELFANDLSTGQFPIDASKAAGSGVIIEPASVWGNNMFTVTLSDFASRSVPGRTWLPEVSSDIKNQVLTVPRFAKDDPPRHVLLAANGDVLRGEIEAATDSHFGFRSGLENLNVPRDRVRAVIWLQPPGKTPASAPATQDEKSPSDPLNHRLQMRISFRGVDLNSVIGFLRSQDNGLKIQPPDGPSTRRVGQIQIGNQTIGEALTMICAQFNLHYRVDPDGTVVLETLTGQGNAGLVSKTYWLKPDAIPPTASLHDALSAKGVTFPKDARVNWQPQAGVLTMVNTDDNQAKLAALIVSDYGGSLGSPTHWVELTDGGRLGLIVDKFGTDFITAHHPVYGAVKVPMSQVYVIRTTAPQLTAASRALENWRLVNAPEPVLPESGGGNSPLLGKDASGFSVPLLDGGDFDLNNERGHVVVLDFWASWCGPCGKSLPGIIDAVSAFPSARVKLIGVNQGEASEQVKRFLQARGLKLTVAMDADQSIGRKYGVDAIPRTVVIGPDGKVAWDQTGYDPDGDSSISDAIKKLIYPSGAADPPAPSAPQ